MEKKLTICIPTFNRVHQTVKNVNLLNKYLSKLNLIGQCNILIADNNSDDFNYIYKTFKNCEWITCVKHESNIGYIENYLFCLNYISTEWVMMVGDDDYIFMDYLSKVFEYIYDDSISAIIPNFYAVDENGVAITGQARDIMQEDVVYDKGNINLILKAHQLSGIVMRKNHEMMDCFNLNCTKNLYLQMFFLGYNLINGKCVHITDTPLKNTVLTVKNFNYEGDNLIGHFFYNINALPISKADKDKIIMYILDGEFTKRVGTFGALKKPFDILRRIEKYDLEEKHKKLAKKRFLKLYLKLPGRLFRKIARKIGREA